MTLYKVAQFFLDNSGFFAETIAVITSIPQEVFPNASQPENHNFSVLEMVPGIDF